MGSYSIDCGQADEHQGRSRSFLKLRMLLGSLACRSRRFLALPRPFRSTQARHPPALVCMSSAAASTIRWRADSDSERLQRAQELNELLRSTRSELQRLVESSTPTETAVHVLLGNEAADADSIVSSMVYATLKRRQDKSASQHDVLHVPVLSIPRAELALRCDVMALFAELQVDTTALLFVDEFPWQTAPQLRVTLLDHNALSNKRVPADAVELQVVEIVDHHSDLGQHLDAEPREVAFADGQALVASTCTLVAERLLAASEPVDALLSTLLLGVIALDSINFDPSAKKVTPRDVAVAEQLEQTAFAPKEPLFQWLQREKFDPKHWAGFSLLNCLQCDYKEFTVSAASTSANAAKLGISAVLIDLEAFVQKAADAAALDAALSAYCRQNELTVLAVMAMFMASDGSRHRQVLFFQDAANNATGPTQRCVEFLQQDGSLQLTPLELPETHRDAHVLAFQQLNTGASRKQVAPLLLRALTDETTGKL